MGKDHTKLANIYNRYLFMIFAVLWICLTTTSVFAQDPIMNRMPIWSPDGEQIAFISDREGDRDLWVMGKDGSNPINLTANFDQPVIYASNWSPDGKSIAFVPFPPGDEKGNLWLVDVEDFSVQNLTADIPPSAGGSHTWSPNSKFIAYGVGNNFDESRIWITELATGQSTPIDVDTVSFSPKWLNDDVLFFISYSETDSFIIQSIDLRSSEINTLDISDFNEFTLSPDGTMIVYAADTDYSDLTTDIVIYSLVENQEVARIHDPRLTLIEGLNWSADGQKVAFDSIYTRCNSEITLNIMMLDIGNGTVSDLVDCKFGNSRDVDWSPDNETLVFWSTHDDDEAIWTINVNTGELVNLTSPSR